MSRSADVRPRSSLSVLCRVIGLLLTGSGSLMIPAGLFVGPELLCGAILYFLAGLSYFIAGSGLVREKSWALPFVVWLSMLIAAVGGLGAWQASRSNEVAGIVIWSAASLFFAVVTFLAWSHRTGRRSA